jgi:phospholipid/cholesterol/gamma-HCH transport system ATP-binding protein
MTATRTAPAQPLIRLRNVSITLDGKPVLQDISFDVAQGETKVILGGSGSGKTTILRLILGLFKPDRGSITIGGEDIGRLSDRGLTLVRRNMAMVFQSAALFDSQSVRENVGYRLWEEGRLSDAEIEPIVRQSLQFVGLEDAIEKMPGELSGGMRKRVGIARALASGAPLILYDEPTAGLDPVNAFAIGHLLLQLKAKGVTQVVVTHDLDLAFRVADHLVMLQRGRMVFAGSPQELAGKQDAEIRGFLDPASLPAEEWNALPSRISQ